MRYSPYDHLESMPHITFGITRLPKGKGWWMPDLQAIAVDDRLGRVERRCVVSHELVHAENQDANCHYSGPDGRRQALRQERRADKIASTRLIDLEDLFEALRVYPLDPAAVADFLDVTPDILRRRLQDLDHADKNMMERRLVGVGAIHER